MPPKEPRKKQGRPKNMLAKQILRNWTHFFDTPDLKGEKIKAYSLSLQRNVKVVFIVKPSTGHTLF